MVHTTGYLTLSFISYVVMGSDKYSDKFSHRRLPIIFAVYFVHKLQVVVVAGSSR